MRSRAGEIVVVPVGACTGVAAPRRLHDDGGGDIASAKRRQCRIQALPDTLRLRPTTGKSSLKHLLKLYTDLNFFAYIMQPTLRVCPLTLNQTNTKFDRKLFQV